MLPAPTGRRCCGRCRPLEIGCARRTTPAPAPPPRGSCRCTGSSGAPACSWCDARWAPPSGRSEGLSPLPQARCLCGVLERSPGHERLLPSSGLWLWGGGRQASWAAARHTGPQLRWGVCKAHCSHASGEVGGGTGLCPCSPARPGSSRSTSFLSRQLPTAPRRTWSCRAVSGLQHWSWSSDIPPPGSQAPDAGSGPQSGLQRPQREFLGLGLVGLWLWLLPFSLPHCPLMHAETLLAPLGRLSPASVQLLRSPAGTALPVAPTLPKQVLLAGAAPGVQHCAFFSGLRRGAVAHLHSGAGGFGGCPPFGLAVVLSCVCGSASASAAGQVYSPC